MDVKVTRSTKDLTQASIQSFLLPTTQIKPVTPSMASSENDVTQETTDMNQFDSNLNQQAKSTLGHDLNDQRLLQADKQHQSLLQSCLQSIKKFDGQGNAEHWITDIIQKFDSLQLITTQQNELIPDILTGGAKVWYFKYQDHMPTFGSFVKNFLYCFSSQESNLETSTMPVPSSVQMKQPQMSESKETVMDFLRNQMLINNLEKLPKFSGKLKQNVSKWLNDIQQAMHMFKLTEEEKLFYIPSCLEGDAKDWFQDNKHLFFTWTTFTTNLIKTFESSGKANVSFNRLRHYEQGFTQDVRQYYFEIIKLCKEANPGMDEASKLQYLKDGLKPSLRFDILLKNPQTPEAFLAYAQQIEELKSLDDKEILRNSSTEKEFTSSLKINKNQINHNYQQGNPSANRTFANNNSAYYKNDYQRKAPSQQFATTTPTQGHVNNPNDVPKPPYRCYRCNGTDHFIYQCPHFQ